MITNESYTCEYCHSEYHDLQYCEACEENHQIPVEMFSFNIRKGQAYPYMVMLKMTDGRIIKYWNTQFTTDADV